MKKLISVLSLLMAFLLFPVIVGAEPKEHFLKFNVTDIGTNSPSVQFKKNNISDDDCIIEVWNMDKNECQLSIPLNYQGIAPQWLIGLKRFDLIGKSVYSLSSYETGPRTGNSNPKLYFISENQGQFQIMASGDIVDYGDPIFGINANYMKASKINTGNVKAFLPFIEMSQNQNRALIYWDNTSNWLGYVMINSYKQFGLSSEEIDYLIHNKIGNEGFRGIKKGEPISKLFEEIGAPDEAHITYKQGLEKLLFFKAVPGIISFQYNYPIYSNMPGVGITITVDVDESNSTVKSISGGYFSN